MQYPKLYNVPIEDHSDAILDGEVACINPKTGTIDFEFIQERFLTRKPMAIMQARVRRPVIFFAFDILRYKGEDLRGHLLMERKELLNRVLEGNHPFSRVINIEDTGVSMFEAIREKQMEGIVAKLKDSRYVGRRDTAWLKIINYQYTVVISNKF